MAGNEPITPRRRTVLVVAGFALISAAAVVADWMVREPAGDLASVAGMLAVFAAAFAVTATFAVWTAGSLGLPSFLLIAPLSARRRWVRFTVYGIGGGILIWLSNGALYLNTATAPLRDSPVYDLGSHLQVFALSARAAISEETMFRLFAIPFLVSLGMRYYGWRPTFGFEVEPQRPAPPPPPPRWLVAAAVLVSAAAFGLAHVTNPLAPTLFGLVLGVAYLRGGWESAATAHFLGNYLLFARLYL